MKSAESFFDFVDCQSRKTDTAWSVGSFGAVAEFRREPNEDVTFRRGGMTLSVVTPRGAMHISAEAGSRLVASESPAAVTWDHRVALCLPREHCAMNGRHELTEIGLDSNAVRDEDRDAVLFDLGLGLVQIDACVRVNDRTVAAALRRYIGMSVFSANSGAMAVICEAGLHRVFISRVGRVEVFQPTSFQDGTSLSGPRTRILPKLIAHGRTHAATEALPGNWIPCAHCHPANPVRDGRGRNRSFDAKSHFAFLSLLDRYGNAERFTLKKRLIHAVNSSYEPFRINNENDRFSRATVLVTLRQLQALNTRSATLAAWLAEYESSENRSDEPTKELPHSLLDLVQTGAK